MTIYEDVAGSFRSTRDTLRSYGLSGLYQRKKRDDKPTISESRSRELGLSEQVYQPPAAQPAAPPTERPSAPTFGLPIPDAQDVKRVKDIGDWITGFTDRMGENWRKDLSGAYKEGPNQEFRDETILSDALKDVWGKVSDNWGSFSEFTQSLMPVPEEALKEI